MFVVSYTIEDAVFPTFLHHLPCPRHYSRYGGDTYEQIKGLALYGDLAKTQQKKPQKINKLTIPVNHCNATK